MMINDFDKHVRSKALSSRLGCSLATVDTRLTFYMLRLEHCQWVWPSAGVSGTGPERSADELLLG